MISVKEKAIDFISDVMEVMETEANAILALKNELNDSINDAIKMILQCKGRVVITGIGKSGIIGRKINATMASTGTPSFFLHPSEGLHGDLGMVMKHDVVIAISNSGESEEVVNLLPSIKKIGSKLISIVRNPNSTLGRKADVVLCIGNAPEACPLGLAPTTSTTVTLALGDALAIALLKARNFGHDDFALFHPAGSLGKKLLLKVDDVISKSQKNPLVYGNATVQEALFQMTAQGLGATSVVDKSNRLIGILTDGDIRRACALSNETLFRFVDDLYNRTPVTISEGSLATEALELMEFHKINVLPVVDSQNCPIGMIHIHDLMSVGL